MRLLAGLAEVAARHGGRTAVASADAALDFAALARESDDLSRALAARGVRPGDRVVIWTDHDPRAAVALWGTWKAGAIAVKVNGRLRPAALADLVADAEPAAALLTGRFVAADGPDAPGAALPADLPPGRVLALDRPLDAPGRGAAHVPRDDDLAALVYTSGSTGRPKGVGLTHRNLGSVASAVVEHMPVDGTCVYMMVVPLHYVHGLMQLLVHAIAGATVHFAGDFLFPADVVARLAATGATEVSGTPYHLSMLVDRGSLLQADLPALRRISITGGRLPAERAAQVLAARPRWKLHVAYGQTECGPRATALDPDRILAKPDAVGAPIPGVAVHVLDEDGRPCRPGQPGEIVVEGPNVMAGYWRQPEATAQVIDGKGRLRTGDVGAFDEDGDLRLVGRADSMIKSAGERLFPVEIERVLLAADGVREAVVVGVPDPLLGQRVEAHVVLEGDEDRARAARRLRAACLAVLPLPRIPAVIHVASDLPRLASGKPDRAALAGGRSAGEAAGAAAD